jgi:hypothetical protein
LVAAGNGWLEAMASTSENTEKPDEEPEEEVKDVLTGKDLEDSLRIGWYMFYVAVTPLIMQVCSFCAPHHSCFF